MAFQNESRQWICRFSIIHFFLFTKYLLNNYFNSIFIRFGFRMFKISRSSINCFNSFVQCAVHYCGISTVFVDDMHETSSYNYWNHRISIECRPFLMLKRISIEYCLQTNSCNFHSFHLNFLPIQCHSITITEKKVVFLTSKLLLE